MLHLQNMLFRIKQGCGPEDLPVSAVGYIEMCENGFAAVVFFIPSFGAVKILLPVEQLVSVHLNEVAL